MLPTDLWLVVGCEYPKVIGCTLEKKHVRMFNVYTTENLSPKQSLLHQVGINHLLGVCGGFRMRRLPLPLKEFPSR